MSRTRKDKKWSLRYPENDYTFGSERIEYIDEYVSYYTGEKVKCTRYIWVDLPGAKKKKKRKEYGDWNWCQATPSWWTRMTMTKPRRRACRIWERQALTSDIEEADCPDTGKNKPHIYYY